MNIKFAAVPIILISTAACDLNPLMGKPSEFEQYQKRLMALEAHFTPPVAITPSEPKTPACVPVFRVVECP